MDEIIRSQMLEDNEQVVEDKTHDAANARRLVFSPTSDIRIRKCFSDQTLVDDYYVSHHRCVNIGLDCTIGLQRNFLSDVERGNLVRFLLLNKPASVQHTDAGGAGKSSGSRSKTLYMLNRESATPQNSFKLERFPLEFLKFDACLKKHIRGLTQWDLRRVKAEWFDSTLPRGGYAREASLRLEDGCNVFAVRLCIGQTRVLRFRRISPPHQWTNVVVTDNTLITMAGLNFQDLFTHRVDELSSKDAVDSHYALTFIYAMVK
jgi:hypothetical protein